jgi:hypothetical protein
MAKNSKSLKIRRKAIFAQNIGAFEGARKKSSFGKKTKKKVTKKAKKKATKKVTKKAKKKATKKVTKKATKKAKKKVTKKAKKKVVTRHRRTVGGSKRVSVTRKSPEQSATLYKVGTVRTGNDSNRWVIKKASNGVKRWVKLNNFTFGKKPENFKKKYKYCKGNSKPKPVNKKLYKKATASVKNKRGVVWPSRYATWKVVQKYKQLGGKYKCS